MKYFKCVDDNNSFGELRNGTIYIVENEYVKDDGICGWIVARFEELSNVEKLLVMGHKVNVVCMPSWGAISRGYNPFRIQLRIRMV
jgi:hypothetical protein